MITNKDVRVENGNLVLNGDKYPLDGQSPEKIMEIVEDNSDSTPTAESSAPVTSNGIKTYIDTAIGDLTQTGITGSDVATQLITAYDKVKRLTQVDEKYTCQTTDLEYTGISVACPAGHVYIVRAQLSYTNSVPTEICAASSNSILLEYLTYARTDKSSFVTFVLMPEETAYIWGKWSTANKQNAVRYNVIDITI